MLLHRYAMCCLLLSACSRPLVDQHDAGATDSGTVDLGVWTSPQWIRQFGSEGDDLAASVEVDSHGAIFVAGTIQGPGQTDAFVRKYDVAGNLTWASRYQTVGSEEGRSVRAALDGGIYVAALTADRKVLVLRYDDSGNKLFVRELPVSAFRRVESVRVSKRGEVYVTGTTQTIDAGVFDPFAAKFDENGDAEWTRQLSMLNDGVATAVGEGPNGDVFVAGEYFDANPDPVAYPAKEVFVRRYDASGTEMWTSLFGLPDDDHLASLDVDDENNVYVAGDTLGTFPGESTAVCAEVFVRRIDSAGSAVWTREFGSPSDDKAGEVRVTPAGVHVIGFGYFGGVVVRRFDSSGALQWGFDFQSESLGNDRGLAIATDFSGAVYVAGQTGTGGDPTVFPGQTSNGGRDGFVGRLVP